MNELWSCSEPVARALAARGPVVALETTLVTHGLPHPQGIAAALALEEEVRASGATPATIGVLRGAIRIGLTARRTRRAGDSPRRLQDESEQPCGRRCLRRLRARQPLPRRCLPRTRTGFGCLQRAASAACTVGGRERRRLRRSHGARALSQSPWCAPAPKPFSICRARSRCWRRWACRCSVWRRTSSRPSIDDRAACRWIGAVDSIEELAAASARTSDWVSARACSLRILSPPRTRCVPTCTIRRSGRHWPSMQREGVRGRAVTPFLLARPSALTGGESVRTNVALLRHNARVAGRLAKELAGRSR